MATKFKFEIESDGLTVQQVEAFSAFVLTLKVPKFSERMGFGTTPIAEPEAELSQGLSIPLQETKEEAPKRKRAPKAKEVEPQAPEAEEDQPEYTQPETAQATDVEVNEPEEVKPAGYSLQDVRARVQEKIQHRAAIKDKLSELGASSVSLLEPSNFAEMVKFLDSL